MLDALRMFGRYAAGLPGFLQHPLSPGDCRSRLERQLRSREDSFLQVLERGIYGNPRSPYRKLLHHARIEQGDVAQAVRREGIEGALGELYGQGVYVTMPEFKGREPIRRPGLEIPVRDGDFDNPLLARHYEARTGGSGGGRTRLAIDFDLLTHEAAYYHFFLKTFGLEGRPIGMWREIPPGSAGMKTVLRYAKLGRQVQRWFTQRPLEAAGGEWKYSLFTWYTVRASRWWGPPGPWPEHVPASQAHRVARWLAEVKRQGPPALFDTYASSAVLLCRAARENGMDIGGTSLRIGGEPFTPAKAQVLREAGVSAAANYHISEIGAVGLGCGAPAHLDEVHLLTDKVAAIQRAKPAGAGGRDVEALVYTTLLPSCPKLMLNVESGDYGVLADRRCGCPVEELGFTRHLHTIRSYGKLTSAGMTFLSAELLSLVEEILPARFGGGPADYQFVEEEEAGLPRVSVVVSPRLDGVNERAVVDAVLERLSACPGGPLMAGVWRDGRTLRVARREPYRTAGFKILPLHILDKTR